MRELIKGEPVAVRVCAKRGWNHTGLSVSEGQRVRLEVDKTSVVDWRDAGIPSSPAGDTRGGWFRYLERWRRLPSSPWYALIGAIGKGPTDRFYVGYGTCVTATTDGELLLFANDVPGFYWNNHGQLTSNVTGLS